MVWLRLRSRHFGRHQPELHLLHDVPSPHTGRSQPSATRRSQRIRLSPLLHPHNRPLQLSPRLLLAASRLRVSHWRTATSGFSLRLLLGQPRNRMVHIFELGHVLQRRQDDGDEGIGCVPSGIVLCRLRHHGYLQQQGQWKTRGHEGWRLGANRRLMERMTLCMSNLEFGAMQHKRVGPIRQTRRAINTKIGTWHRLKGGCTDKLHPTSTPASACDIVQRQPIAIDREGQAIAIVENSRTTMLDPEIKAT